MKPATTLLLLLISTTTVLTQTEGSCKNGCVSCRTNGEVEWCLACSGAKHIVTNATNGRCEGAPIANCVFQSQDMQNNQLCYQCEYGYGLVLKEVVAEEAADGKMDHYEGYTCKAIDNSTMATSGYFYTKKDEGATEKFVAQTCHFGYELNQNKEKCTLSAERIPYVEHCLIYNSVYSRCDLCDGKRIYDKKLESCVDDVRGILGINSRKYIKGKWLRDYDPNYNKGFIIKEARPNKLYNYRKKNMMTHPYISRKSSFVGLSHLETRYPADYQHFTSEEYGDVGMVMTKKGFVVVVWSLVVFLGFLVFSK